jgi:hypothetical protein
MDENHVYRRARPRQKDEVLAVLDESAAWLAAQGVRQWPGRFERAWIEPLRAAPRLLVNFPGGVDPLLLRKP